MDQRLGLLFRNIYRCLFVLFVLCYVSFLTFSDPSLRSKSKPRKKNTGRSILILSRLNTIENAKYQYHKKIIHHLRSTKVDTIKAHKFRNLIDLDGILKTKEKFFQVYVFLGKLDYSKIMDYHKDIINLKNKLGNNTVFYFDETNYFTKWVYHPIVKYLTGINLINRTKDLIHFIKPNISDYRSYEVKNKNRPKRLNLSTFRKSTSQCLSYPALNQKLIKKTKNRSVYKPIPPPAYKRLLHEFLLHCFFKNKKTNDIIVYEILYPKKTVTLLPREILVFYESQKIIEKEFDMNSDIFVKHVDLSIQINDLKGKPPVIFINNQKWRWSSSKKKLKLLDVKNSQKLASIDLGPDGSFDLAVIGGEKDHLSGTLRLEKKGRLLKEFPLSFRPSFFGGNLLSWFFIYSLESVLFFSFLLFLPLFFVLRKRRQSQLNTVPGTSLGQFVFMIKKPQKFFLSKHNNPFNCTIPFLDESCIIKADDSTVSIQLEKNQNEKLLDLNATLGKARFQLGDHCEVLFSHEKFRQKKDRSVILMKVQEIRIKNYSNSKNILS